MGFFNKVEFDESSNKQKTILQSSVYLAQLDSVIRDLLNQINKTEAGLGKLKLLEKLKWHEQNTEEITKKVLELRKETRKATIKEIDKTKETIKKLREKQEILQQKTVQLPKK